MKTKMKFLDDALAALRKYRELKRKKEEIENEMDDIKMSLEKWLRIHNMEYTNVIDEAEDIMWKIELVKNKVVLPNWTYLEMVLTEDQLEKAKIEKDSREYLKITELKSRRRKS